MPQSTGRESTLPLQRACDSLGQWPINVRPQMLVSRVRRTPDRVTALTSTLLGFSDQHGPTSRTGFAGVRVRECLHSYL